MQGSIVKSREQEKATESNNESSSEYIIEMNLNTLREFFKLNNYYLNIIQYKNIFVNVIVYISIKEGRKILKGIKHLLDIEKTVNKCTIDGIVEIRSYLLLLKMVIDVLFTTIEKNTHIFVCENYRIKKFIALVDSVIDTLNTKIDIEKDIEFMCLTVNVTLDHIQNPKNLGDREFYVYYFKEPMRHLYELFSLQ